MRSVRVLLVAALLFFLPAWMQGKIYLATDFLKMAYPFRTAPGFDLSNPLAENYGDLQDPLFQLYAGERFAEREMRRGHLPLWDPQLGAGVPLHAVNPSALLSPLHWPFALIGGVAGRSLEQFCQLFAMGLSMWWFLRRCGTSSAAATVGGLAWMLGGWTVSWLQFLAFAWANVLIPACLAAVEGLRSEKRGSLALLGLFYGMLVSSGALLAALYYSVLLGAYAVYRLPARRWPVVGLALLLGLGLSAPTWLGQVELTRLSGRLGASSDYAVTRLVPRELAGWSWPFFLGDPASGFFLGGVVNSGVVNLREHSLYIGFLPFLLALVGLARRDCRFWTALSLVCLLYMLDTPLTWVTIALVKPANQIPLTRILPLFQLCLVVLAAHGWDRAQQLSSHRIPKAWWAWLALCGGFVVLSWWRLQSDPALLMSWLKLQNGALDQPPYVEAQAFKQLIATRLQQHASFANPHFWLPLLLGVGVLVSWKQRRTHLLIGLTVADLLWFSLTMNRAQPAATLFPVTPTLAKLQKVMGQQLPAREPALRIAGLKQMAPPNSLANLGLNDVGLDLSTFPGIYRQFFQVLSPQENLQLQVGLFEAPHYGPGTAHLLGVGAHYTDPFQELRLPFGPGQRFPDMTVAAWRGARRAYLVGAAQELSDGEVFAGVANADFDPRLCVFLHDGPAGALRGKPGEVGSIEWVSYDSNHLEVRLKAEQPGWFLLSDCYYPGWSASLDGADVPVRRADICFRAVEVPVGEHRLTMTYRPVALRWGLPIQCLALLALAGLGWRRK